MTRLIDGDALKELMIDTLEHIKANPQMDGQEAHLIAAMHMLGEMIDDAPTVDAVPVIRCRECNKWKKDDGTLPDFDGKEWHGCKELESFTSKIWAETEPVTPAWFYCGYAEKEEV